VSKSGSGRSPVKPGEASRDLLGPSGVSADLCQPLSCAQACPMAGLAADSVIGFFASAGIGPRESGGRQKVRLGPGVRPVVQGVGILSVPGGLVLSGHPVVGVIGLFIAMGLYGLVLLCALFGTAEISRRGFLLLGVAGNATGRPRE
jgi:hypothetical protein